MNKYSFKVEQSTAGQRLDLYLALNIPTFSRSQIKYSINHNEVTVNGVIEFHPQYRIKNGDEIVLTTNAKQQSVAKERLLTTEMDLDIVYEDEDILAINKPTNMNVFSLEEGEHNTLANGVKYYLKSKGEYQFGENRVGQVHRLDSATSGIILFAKTPLALWKLGQQFADHKIEKVYLAVVSGVTKPKFESDVSIGPKQFGKGQGSDTDRPRKALTQFERLDITTDRRFSLLWVMPLTGRTHQIRVHLSELGFPIVGDKFYEGRKFDRLMLHALQITFEHPATGKIMTLKAPPGRDFKEGLKIMKLKLPGNLAG